MSDQIAVSSTAELNPGVAIQYAIHAAVRRDMNRLVEALGEPAVASEAVTGYTSEFLFHLHHHHTFEDDEVWPAMGQRLGEGFTALLAQNAAEHEQVAESVAVFAAAVERLDGDRAPARAAAIHMRDVVSEHLDHEEADVIPLIPQAFTLDDFARFQALSAKENPPERFLPWVLEAAPEPVATGFGGALPPPVRELAFTTWMPVWQAKVDALTESFSTQA